MRFPHASKVIVLLKTSRWKRVDELNKCAPTKSGRQFVDNVNGSEYWQTSHCEIVLQLHLPERPMSGTGRTHYVKGKGKLS